MHDTSVEKNTKNEKLIIYSREREREERWKGRGAVIPGGSESFSFPGEKPQERHGRCGFGKLREPDTRARNTKWCHLSVCPSLCCCLLWRCFTHSPTNHKPSSFIPAFSGAALHKSCFCTFLASWRALRQVLENGSSRPICAGRALALFPSQHAFPFADRGACHLCR